MSVDQVLEVFGRVRGPFSVLLHSPKLAEQLLKLVTVQPRGQHRRAAIALDRDAGRGAREGGGVCLGGAGRMQPAAPGCARR